MKTSKTQSLVRVFSGFCSVCIVLAFCFTAEAKTTGEPIESGEMNQSTSDDPEHIRPGKRALQFGIGPNFDITSFKGSTFSYKWMGNNNRAYRFSNSLLVNSLKREADREMMSGSIRSLESNTFTEFEVSADVDFEFMHYSSLNNPVYFYWGYGPSFSFSHTNTTDENVITRLDTNEVFQGQEERIKSSEIGGGAGLTFGVEWFPVDYISFSAEYHIAFQLTFANINEKEYFSDELTTERETESSQIQFAGRGARLSVSVYF